MSNGVQFIPGGLAVDDRGALRFCNDFDMSNAKRFYVVSNHEHRTIRAWHAHKVETKYAYVASGAALIAALTIPLVLDTALVTTYLPHMI